MILVNNARFHININNNIQGRQNSGNLLNNGNRNAFNDPNINPNSGSNQNNPQKDPCNNQ